MLHFSQAGKGPPLIILHGLFGSGRNWASIARALGEAFVTYSLDQRNHGESPALPTHSLNDLTQDLAQWIDEHSLTRTSILGHSMGGLVAMDFALQFPQRMDSLIVVDVAPRAYAHRHQKEIEAMRADISGCKTRADVDAVMAQFLPDAVIRQFLQMNLIHTEAGFRWKIPVETLAKATFLEGFTHNVGRKYDRPALFIVGGLSDYVKPEDHAAIYSFFPKAKVVTLADAGHWPHYSHQQVFLEHILSFLKAEP
ncbi:MAG: alpha/beta fold hydrolase [Leptospirales bacterium]|nr:alpha/beta fold hydrolase [Leptospirales bacterium]